jgi:hypothetical protein
MMDKGQRIPAKQVVLDILSGVGDEGLMARYGLSHRGIERLFKKLLSSNLITQDELYHMSSFYKKKIDKIMSRLHPRADLGIKIPIYDVTSGTVGLLRDISEKGLRAAGIEAEVGEARTFQIPVDVFINADPLLVIAECQWMKIKGKLRKYPVAGFEIKETSQSDAKILEAFVNCLLLTKSGEWQTLREKSQDAEGKLDG